MLNWIVWNRTVITGTLVKWVECSPMVRETWVRSQVASYQRLLKWYSISPWLTLSNIRCVSRVKWKNPRKGVAPSPTPGCSSYWKESLLVALDYDRQNIKMDLALNHLQCHITQPNPTNQPTNPWSLIFLVMFLLRNGD